MAIDRPYPHPRVLSDPGHRDSFPMAADEFGGRVKHSLTVAKRVLARLAGSGMRHASHHRSRLRGRREP